MAAKPASVAGTLTSTATVLVTVAALLVVANYNFLLFHTAAEFFSIAVAFGIFFIAWNTRSIAGSGFFLALGVLYLYVGIVDMFHTIAFKGIGVFDGGEANLATQLWVAARLLESAGLLGALAVTGRPSGWTLQGLYGGASVLLLASILWLDVFPTAYVEGEGLTFFKIAAEYFVVALLLAALLMITLRRDIFTRRSFNFLVAMVALKILSEVTFTAYGEVNDFAVQVGHVLKVLAFYMAYQATIKTVLSDPYEALFHDLERTRESLARSEENFRRAIAPAPVAVFSLDRDLRFTWVYNPHILSLRGNVIGRGIDEVYGPEDAARLRTLCRRVTELALGVRERLHLSHGESGSFEITLEPLRSKGTMRAVTGIIGTAIDVTELMEARAEAERANFAKSRFLATASHDLRQPFQAMRLFHHLLEQQLENDGQKHISSRLAEAMTGGERLLNNLLDISTLEAGRVQANFANVRVEEVLRQVAGEIEPQAAAKGLELRLVQCSATVRSDPVLLARMLRNLATNAVRYTRQGRILIGCRRLGNSLRIEVWDTGPGIPADKLDTIFEDFYRLEEGGDERGMGLGLSIVSRLGVLLNHKAGVRSWLGKGSVFSIEVPRAEGDDIELGASYSQPATR